MLPKPCLEQCFTYSTTRSPSLEYRLQCLPLYLASSIGVASSTTEAPGQALPHFPLLHGHHTDEETGVSAPAASVYTCFRCPFGSKGLFAHLTWLTVPSNNPIQDLQRSRASRNPLWDVLNLL